MSKSERALLNPITLLRERIFKGSEAAWHSLYHSYHFVIKSATINSIGCDIEYSIKQKSLGRFTVALDTWPKGAKDMPKLSS